jgi:hypothetical protein
MLFQANATVMWIVYVLIATVILWLFLWLATRLIAGKNVADNKKLMLLLSALIIIIVIPLITGFIGSILGVIGNALADLRTLIYPSGSNQLTRLVSAIEFLLILLVLKLLVTNEWKDALWIGLIGFFLLYMLLTLIPELMLFSL